MIFAAYEQASKNLSRAAKALGIPRSTLRDKLRRYGAL
jgi:DNA-binding protein Fis